MNIVLRAEIVMCREIVTVVQVILSFYPVFAKPKPNEYASSILYWDGVCFVSVGRYKRQKSLTVTVFSMY